MQIFFHVFLHFFLKYAKNKAKRKALVVFLASIMYLCDRWSHKKTPRPAKRQ